MVVWKVEHSADLKAADSADQLDVMLAAWRIALLVARWVVQSVVNWAASMVDSMVVHWAGNSVGPMVGATAVR